MALDQRNAWDSFGMFESATTIPAGRLVDRAGIKSGERGLDVGCGTGVVAITAARRGAKMSGIDPSAALMQRAQESCTLAGVNVDFHVAGAEDLPFSVATFDVVLSQFGHIFAPDAARATGEMLRVLKPGGRLAVSVWDADEFPGQLWDLLVKYERTEIEPAVQWGRSEMRAKFFAGRLAEITETSEVMNTPCLSPRHTFQAMSRAIAPLALVVDQLATDEVALETLRQEVLTLISAKVVGNVLPQAYTIVTGTKY